MVEILRRDCEIESEIWGALNGFLSWRVKKTLFLACAERSGILGIEKIAPSDSSPQPIGKVHKSCFIALNEEVELRSCR